RAVATVGTKAPDDDSAVILLENAKGALSVERASLHEFLTSEWKMSWEEVLSAPMNPTNLAYTNYLLSVASLRPFEEGLAAILPCFWVYFEVGRELVKRGSPVPAYRRWIDTYSSPEYERAVMSVVELSERSFSGLTGEGFRRVKLHFRVSTIYEYVFWDAAYRMERWPFPVQR
ncbi:MAG: TenA family protein, partial [Thaumarchaeota archaeon]|nr:TenA family protein [Candidatus Calditenuaceae archaeon]